MKVKVCLHNHTAVSRYAISTVEDYKKALESGKIDKVAITDHDYFHSAKEIQKELGEDRIIIGEEISTTDGDIIGLFLKKFIPSGLSASRICDLIKAQGGLVYIPHPFSKKGLSEKVMEQIKHNIDVVEVYNGWMHRSLAKPLVNGKSNDKAEKWAKENNIPGMSGSDAHYPSDIGSCYTEMEDFSDKDSFLKSLKGELNLMKRRNRTNLTSFRTFAKGFFRRDILRFIKS